MSAAMANANVGERRCLGERIKWVNGREIWYNRRAGGRLEKAQQSKSTKKYPQLAEECASGVFVVEREMKSK
jgi:hypothetical protein